MAFPTGGPLLSGSTLISAPLTPFENSSFNWFNNFCVDFPCRLSNATKATVTLLL